MNLYYKEVKNGNSWFGIVSTRAPADTNGDSGNEANFRSYADIIIDNLKIDMTAQELLHINLNNTLVSGLDAYTPAARTQYQNAYHELLKLKDKENLTIEEVNEKTELVKAATQALVIKRDTASVVRTSGSQETAGENGKIMNAFDGNLSTIWHSKWSEIAVNKPITIFFDGAPEITKFTYVPRTSGSNGDILEYKLELVTDTGERKTFTQVLPSTKVPKVLEFGAPIKARFAYFTPIRTLGNPANTYASAAELIFTVPPVQEVEVDETPFTKLLNQLSPEKEAEILEKYNEVKSKIGINDEIVRYYAEEKLNEYRGTVAFENPNGKVESKENKLDRNLKLNVEEISASDKEKLVDIYFTNDNNEKVEVTNGQFEVTLDVPEGKVADKVYFVDGTNKVIVDESPRQVGTKVTFTTTHFSHYAIAFKESKPADPIKPEKPDQQDVKPLAPNQSQERVKPNTNAKKDTDTSDSSNVAFAIVIGMISLLGLVFLSRKRRIK